MEVAWGTRFHSFGRFSPACSPVSRLSKHTQRNINRCRALTAEAPALTKEQVEQFHRDGFLVLERFSSAEEVTELRKRAGELVQGFEPSSVKSIFSTTNQRELTDKYFYDSAANVSFFFEEKAFDDHGNLRQDKSLSINKMGHGKEMEDSAASAITWQEASSCYMAIHDKDPVFRAFSRSPKVSSILQSLGYKRPLPVQSMYIFKQPNIGGEVVPHQDSTFIYTEPKLSCVGLWWALENANRYNGCLWAQPGVHKEGLKRRFFVSDGKVTFDKPPPDYEMDKFVPLECPAGTLVLLHGENIHASAENTSPISRHSYSMHIVEGTPEYKWPEDNWAQRPADDPWEPFYET